MVEASSGGMQQTIQSKRLVPESNTYLKSIKSKHWNKIAIYSVLIGWSVIVLLPLLWLLSSSLKTQAELAFNIWGPPKEIYFLNYYLAWTKSYMGRYMLNSVIATAVAIVLTDICATTISYALSRFHFRFNRVLYYLIIAGMMIPIHSAVIPIYIMAMDLGMQNNLYALGMIYAAFRIPISVFILESFMITIPKELEECAIIDGCSYSRIFLHVILPLSKDGILTITILTALACWNELLVAMLMLGQPLVKTLPIGLLGFIAEFSAEYTQMSAGLLIATVPNIIFYALLQEKIVKGMTIGAIKG
ncbi:carbohydrate ABC transporter permease [Marispirochaeta aestuarii]|uniref:carbohydrate ABC transporter permease n=1 Tax=Marispirochaeta aestuarii TaxID=1963862 RepID=UPI0029C8D02C|nr:carbohydrate ABC transporter permease [Marispirochaeta aestuarii]